MFSPPQKKVNWLLMLIFSTYFPRASISLFWCSSAMETLMFGTRPVSVMPTVSIIADGLWWEPRSLLRCSLLLAVCSPLCWGLPPPETRRERRCFHTCWWLCWKGLEWNLKSLLSVALSSSLTAMWMGAVVWPHKCYLPVLPPSCSQWVGGGLRIVACAPQMWCSSWGCA